MLGQRGRRVVGEHYDPQVALGRQGDGGKGVPAVAVDRDAHQDVPGRQVAQFLESLREAGGADALSVFLESWQDRLTMRRRNLLAGAAQLDAYLTVLGQTQ